MAKLNPRSSPNNPRTAPCTLPPRLSAAWAFLMRDAMPHRNPASESTSTSRLMMRNTAHWLKNMRERISSNMFFEFQILAGGVREPRQIRADACGEIRSVVGRAGGFVDHGAFFQFREVQ